MAVVGDTLFAVGGRLGSSYAKNLNTHEAYDPETDRWQTMIPMPTARHGLGTAMVGDRIYVIGGGPQPGGSFSNVNEVFRLQE